MSKRKLRLNREASGRRQRPCAAERANQVMAVARNAPHRRAILTANGQPPDPRDARLGSELGRLRIQGHLTAEQYAAGLRWARIVARMRRAIDAPSDRAKGILGALAGSSGPAVDMSPEDAAAARSDYADAWHVLARTGSRMPRILWMTTVADHPCHDLPALRTALDALAAHFDEQGAIRTIPRRPAEDVAAT